MTTAVQTAPRISSVEAVRIATEFYDFHVSAAPLPSERDQNFCCQAGNQQFILHPKQRPGVAPEMDKRFPLGRRESIPNPGQAIEHAHRKQQIRASHVTLIDGRAPSLLAPLSDCQSSFRTCA